MTETQPLILKFCLLKSTENTPTVFRSHLSVDPTGDPGTLGGLNYCSALPDFLTYRVTGINPTTTSPR
jgi:hypothetical protein